MVFIILVSFAPQLLFGSFLMANIVTTSHQSEELMFSHEHDWVRRWLEHFHDFWANGVPCFVSSQYFGASSH